MERWRAIQQRRRDASPVVRDRGRQRERRVGDEHHAAPHAEAEGGDACRIDRRLAQQPPVGGTQVGGIEVYLGNGDGTFTYKGHFAGGRQSAGMAVADFNNDGNPDLVLANFSEINGATLLASATLTLNANRGIALSGAGTISTNAPVTLET